MFNLTQASLLIRNLYILVIVFFIYYFSPGGIDLFNYHNESEIGVLTFNLYQLKEFVSWFFIKLSILISDSIGVYNPALILSFFSFLLLSFYRKRFGISSLSLYLCLINPITILLIMNVLRQYVSVIFIILAIFYINSGSKKKFLFFCILAFFSHNSSIIISIIIYFCYSYSRNKMIMLLFFGFLFVYLLKGPLFAAINFGSDYDYSGTSEIVKFLGYVFVLFFCLLFLCIKLCLKDRLDLRFYQFCTNLGICFLLVSIGFYLISIPIWVINRFLVSFIAILVFSFHLKSIKTTNQLILDSLFLTLSGVMLFFHAGAYDMVFGYL
ncbi:EpsG family protein [Vibrio harveyi]